MIRREQKDILRRWEEITSPGTRADFASFLSGWRECEKWLNELPTGLEGEWEMSDPEPTL